jgi:hypothetical protein
MLPTNEVLHRRRQEQRALRCCGCPVYGCPIAGVADGDARPFSARGDIVRDKYVMPCIYGQPVNTIMRKVATARGGSGTLFGA